MGKGYYAVPGESYQAFCLPRHAPKGAVLMNEGRPTEHNTCRTEGCADGFGVWGLDIVASWVDDIESEPMSREIEEVWDFLGIGNAPTYTQEIYNKKKEIRGRKPV